MTSITIEITGHPVPKGRGRAVVNKYTGKPIIHTPKKTRKWEDDARMVARAEMGTNPPWIGPIRLSVVAEIAFPGGWPKWKLEALEEGLIRHTTRPDLDNIIKTAKDAMNGILWKDDCQVIEISAMKFYGERPRVMLQVTPLSGFASQIKTKAELEAESLGGAG